MKKFFITFLFILVSICAFASNWKEIQSKEIPKGTAIYYYSTDSGNIKYCIYIDGYAISVSETNAKEFIAGRRRLEIVKWYNSEKDAYKYTIRQLKNVNLNLDNVIWQKQEQSPLNVK